MKDKVKPSAKVIRKKEDEGPNKIFVYLTFFLLAVLLISFMVPVHYIPLLNNISRKYGLGTDITRKLTLLDLALNSFGIETKNMASVFKKQDVEYEPEIFYSSRFNLNGGANRLINVKETYYHEYERTHKRPLEVAGIYKNGKEAGVPELDGDLKGVRSLPKDDGLTDFSYKKSTERSSVQEEILGSKQRQVRGSFEREGENTQGQGSQPNKHEPLPDFASSVYSDEYGGGEPQTLKNSRMVRPVVIGEPFSVDKSESVIAKLVGDSSLTDTFASLRNFGGYDGVLGYYIKDDLPKEGLFDFYGSSGKDAFISYFYSHAAVDRKYVESSKHLAEIAFHGDDPQDEILIAKGQKQDKIPTMNEADMSPVSLILTVKRNMKECEQGRQHYEQVVRPLKTQYNSLKARLMAISHGGNNTNFEGLQNVAEMGAPGSCKSYQTAWMNRTALLRAKWNSIVSQAKAKCIAIRNAGEAYADSCEMVQSTNPNKDSCEAIDALTVDGGTAWIDTSHGWCRRYVKWKRLNASKSFHGCNTRSSCETAQEALFKEIDDNIQLDTKPGFMFN
ncbi:MAG: hypothetical protein II726_01665 [Elusimicrobiaceae bacterium]|nr:hypothetical protein [Elusimicrobiaceae bacterium]